MTKTQLLRLALGIIGVIGCSASVGHLIVEVKASPNVLLFFVLALVAAFIIGTVMGETRDEDADHPRPATPPPPPGGYQPRPDGAPDDYPHNPPRRK